MQTTEFETSIKLKKLGILQTATFEHVDHKYIPKSNLNYGFRLKKSDNLYSEDAIFADAYTLDEVLDMLPRDILYSFGIKDCNNDYKAYFEINDYDEYKEKDIRHKNPAEAAGQLLVWCIENDYVKVEELNNANNA